jgi:hypothetical protein
VAFEVCHNLQGFAAFCARLPERQRSLLLRVSSFLCDCRNLARSQPQRSALGRSKGKAAAGEQSQE